MASYNPQGKEVPFAIGKTPDAPTPAFQRFQQTSTGSKLDPYGKAPGGPADTPGPVAKFGSSVMSGAQTYFLTKALYDVGHNNTPNAKGTNDSLRMGRRMRRQRKKQRWADERAAQREQQDFNPSLPPRQGLGAPPQSGGSTWEDVSAVSPIDQNDPFAPRSPQQQAPGRKPKAGHDPRQQTLFDDPDIWES